MQRNGRGKLRQHGFLDSYSGGGSNLIGANSVAFQTAQRSVRVFSSISSTHLTPVGVFQRLVSFEKHEEPGF